MEQKARTLVIINPASARARRAWPEIKAALSGGAVRFDSYETLFAGDATKRTRAALREGYRVIAVVGGDGTLSEAASGFFDFGEETKSGAASSPSPINEEAALALLPTGTGDDFARGLMKRRAPLAEWLDKLIASQKEEGERRSSLRAIDVIHGHVPEGERDFICLNVATIGLGAEVAARVAAQGRLTKRLPGEARFVSAALGALAAWRERSLRLRLDEGEVIECQTNLLAVANGIYAGGGMMFAPDARSDDGLIDFVRTHDLTRSVILRELPRIRRGEHLANPRVELTQVQSVRIENERPSDALLVEADGNVRGRTPAEFRILPRALRIII